MAAIEARVLRPGLWAVGLALAVWVLAFAPRGFFSGDSGVKFVQAYGLWTSGFSSRALPHDHAVDPDERYFPYQRQDFTRVVNGERQGTYSLVFCGVSAVLVGLLGRAGLAIPALLGALLILWGMARASARAGLRPGLTLATVAAGLLATPVLFYASQLAEHTLAAGLAIAAYALISPVRHTTAAGAAMHAVQMRPAAAGALAALAATMRPEGYCMVAALGIALVATPGLSTGMRARHGLAYLAGCVPVLAGYWLLNLATAGTWDPLVNANSGAGKAASSYFTAVLFWGELPRQARPWTWLALAALPAILALVPARALGRWPRIIVHALAGVLIAVTAARAQDLATGRVLSGLLCVTPLLAYGLLAGPWQPRARGPWLVAVLFLVQLAVLPSGGNAGGLQLGARLLIPAMPFLCLLAALVVEDDLAALAGRGWKRLLAGAVPVALVALGVAGMATGLPQALRITRDGEELARNAAALPTQVIIARRGWESQLAATVLLDGKSIYEAHGNLRPLAEALHARGHDSFAVIDRKPIEFSMSGGFRTRTVKSVPGWLDLQHVVIDRR